MAGTNVGYVYYVNEESRYLAASRPGLGTLKLKSKAKKTHQPTQLLILITAESLLAVRTVQLETAIGQLQRRRSARCARLQEANAWLAAYA